MDPEVYRTAAASNEEARHDAPNESASAAPGPPTGNVRQRRYRRHRRRRGWSRVERLVQRRGAVLIGCIAFVLLYIWIVTLLLRAFQQN